jgi:hypothetical protein
LHRNNLQDNDEQISNLLKNIIDKDDNKKQHIAEKKSTREKIKMQ